MREIMPFPLVYDEPPEQRKKRLQNIADIYRLIDENRPETIADEPAPEPLLNVYAPFIMDRSVN